MKFKLDLLVRRYVDHVANLLTSSGGDYSRAYIDVKDAQWLFEGDLKPLDVNSISPSQFVIYRFGVFVIRILNKFIQTPEVHVRVAHIAMYMVGALQRLIFGDHVPQSSEFSNLCSYCR